MSQIPDYQFFDVLPKEIVDKCISYYDSIGSYRSETMQKASPGESLEWVMPFLKEHFPIGKFLGGNYYKHSVAYLPHTDHQLEWGASSVNIVLPLWYTGTPASLIVFDQWWDGNPVTWTMIHKPRPGVISSSTNGQLQGLPGNYDIHNKTGEEMEHHFWAQHLQYPKECYKELSGDAFPFTPGSAIMFDNTKIHCTSKFIGTKLGLSLRFTYEG